MRWFVSRKLYDYEIQRFREALSHQHLKLVDALNAKTRAENLARLQQVEIQRLRERLGEQQEEEPLQSRRELAYA